MTITWRCAPFAALTTAELYRILRLRQEVFVVEQTCPYLDADGRDADASHLWTDAADGARALACARLFAPGVRYAEACIGRVATAAEARRTGLGRMGGAGAARWRSRRAHGRHPTPPPGPARHLLVPAGRPCQDARVRLPRAVLYMTASAFGLGIGFISKLPPSFATLWWNGGNSGTAGCQVTRPTTSPHSAGSNSVAVSGGGSGAGLAAGVGLPHPTRSHTIC